MVKGRWKRVESSDENESEFRFVYRNTDLEDILGTTSLREEIVAQKMRYYGHICRRDNNSLTKKMMFSKSKRPYFRDPWKKIADEVGVEREQILKTTQLQSKFRDLCSTLPI